MAFWNRKKKREFSGIPEEIEVKTKSGREVQELFDEVDSSQKRMREKEERRKRKRARKTEEDLYKAEMLLPTGKEDQKRYVTECCENIRDIDEQIKSIRGEYQEVTDSLMDIQKMDRIEGEDKKALRNAARNIVNLTKERNQYKNRNLTIPDAVIRRFEPYEDELVSEIKKMYEAENYQKLIDNDLELLHREKKMLRAEQSEIVERQNALKGLAKVLIGVIVILLLTFGALYLTLEIDLTLPYLATISLAAVSAAVIFVEAQKNRKGMSLAARKLDKAIGLLNKVKIKCVNNLNLLEYNQEKFGVKDAKTFEAYWNEYCKAKEYERRFKENTERLNLYSMELKDILKEYALLDTEIWVAQAVAIIDNREMVEIRHKLNQRRQLLRERIEYNEDMKSEFVKNIDELLKSHPVNREELLEIVKRFSE